MSLQQTAAAAAHPKRKCNRHWIKYAHNVLPKHPPDRRTPSIVQRAIFPVLSKPLGAVLRCDIASAKAYDSVYDLLHKVVSNFIFNWVFFFLICVVISVGWRIKSLDPLYANQTWNRMAIRTQNRIRVDGPLPSPSCPPPNKRNGLAIGQG
jgi:hypothetical protein